MFARLDSAAAHNFFDGPPTQYCPPRVGWFADFVRRSGGQRASGAVMFLARTFSSAAHFGTILPQDRCARAHGDPAAGTRAIDRSRTVKQKRPLHGMS